MQLRFFFFFAHALSLLFHSCDTRCFYYLTLARQDLAFLSSPLPRSPQLPRLHEALLYGPDGGISKPLHDIFERYVHDPNFEVAADAFDTLTTLLVNNKALVFNCLNPEGGAAPLARYIELFVMYNRCLTSDNYVLKRQVR